MKQVQTALELYFNDINQYPASLDFGGSGQVASGTKVYMSVVPSNPSPRDDGACTNFNYAYTRDDTTTYHIRYCISEATGGIPLGNNNATPAGITD
jgi:hypothetical protein